MKLPATIKIGIATALATWAAPKVNAMVSADSGLTMGDDRDIPDAPDMIVPLTGVITALSYTVLSMVFGGEKATVAGGGGAS